MVRLPLKNFAKAQLDKVQLRFPFYDHGDFSDPERINAIFPRYEWLADGPLPDLSEARDWQHIYAVNCTSGDSIEVFFERLAGGAAVTWARLTIDGRTLILHEACYKDHSDASTNVYSAGGVRLECTGPLRFWRVSISALFLEESPNEGGSPQSVSKPAEVYVKVGARLSVISHPFEMPKHCPPSFLARKYRAVHEDDAGKMKDSIRKCCAGLEAFVQGMALFTEVTIEGERREVLLHGCRLKFMGKSDLLENVRHFTGYAENGTVFHLMETPGKVHGFCFHPSHFVTSVYKGRVNRAGTTNQNDENTSLVLTFNTKTKVATYSYSMAVTLRDIATVSNRRVDLADVWSMQEITGELTRVRDKEKYTVRGVAFTLPERYPVPPERLQRYSLTEAGVGVALDAQVVSTFEEACRSPALTGGKGSSLAVLTAIAKYLSESDNAQDKSLAFTVPPAVVLTIGAYTAFAELPAVQSAIGAFLKSVKNHGTADEMSALKGASHRCMAALTQVALPASLEQLVTVKLAEVFGRGWQSKRFAVRSSAVGEDSEEMSAAGQMTTFLGVVGKKPILEAVVQCWASQFELTAVTYKLQYGQILDGPMAVVIQEMAPAQCAGVMFTCDPVTSRPGRIVITGNFGLGESVVSAAADPDTYTLQSAPGNREAAANADVEPTVTLLSKVCGTKDRMIVESQYGTGTEEKIVAMDEAQKFCLTDDQAIQLATIGLKVTEFTSTPRDIEWALVGGRVVLLQSRPVTSVFRETDFEVLNDLNSGIYTHRELLSRANLDEVMPGVFSALSISLVQQILFESFSSDFMEDIFPHVVDQSQYTYTQAFTIGKKAFMNFSNNIFSSKKQIENMEVMMFGCDISEHEAVKNAIFHEKKQNRRNVLQLMAYMWHICTSVEEAVKSAKEQADNVHIDVSRENDSLSILLSLLKQMSQIKDSLRSLMSATFPSSIFNVMTLNVLKSSQGLKKATPELMVILSKLLRSDYEVESARIPEELSKLATCIRNDPKGKEFPDMSLEDALEWLQNDEGEPAKEFQRLRKKHAHRCYKEFDIYSKTWDMDPSPLVQTLQANVRANEVKKREEERLKIDDLEKQPSFIQKKLLNIMIPRAQYSVFAREATKSCLIKCIHQVRLASTRLAQYLQDEGRLPDADLVYFLTADEIYRLITTRNPNILPRAIRRSRMHSRLNTQRFPMLVSGWPKPVESEGILIPEGARSISGTPVSEGVVVGVARVIHDFLSEAHLIQKGDILVTRATDTGWTPYFSLLSGVVTELGGLLSHGAVVAREYGLPAVVGVLGATDFFKSGETITLDGNNGVVAKQDEEAGETGAPVDGDQVEGTITNTNGKSTLKTNPSDIQHYIENGRDKELIESNAR